MHQGLRKWMTNEGSSKGVDLREVQRSVEGRGETNTSVDFCNYSLVTGFDSEDGSSCGQVCVVGDFSSSSEVGRDTNRFQNARDSQSFTDRLVAEVVLARLDSGSAKSAREESDVSSFFLSQKLDALVNPLGVTSSSECLFVKFLQDTVVEVVLQVFESKGVVKDSRVDVRLLSSNTKGEGRDGESSSSDLHCNRELLKECGVKRM